MRNCLLKVFGIESAEYAYEGDPFTIDTQRFKVVKTHLLPHQLPIVNHPKIYLVREGRDSLVSQAFHRRNFIDKTADINQTITEAVLASDGSYFGGWSRHCFQWISQADLVIRFEDLVNNPEIELRRIEEAFQLGDGDYSQIPTFESQKNSGLKYSGNGKIDIGTTMTKQDPSLFFRKGKIGNWKEELPVELAELFWIIHGHTMDQLGYYEDGRIAERNEFFRKLELCKAVETKAYKNILIEGSKLNDEYVDGIKRYVETLIKALTEYNFIANLDFIFYIKRESKLSDIPLVNGSSSLTISNNQTPSNILEPTDLDTKMVIAVKDAFSNFDSEIRKIKSSVGLTFYRIKFLRKIKIILDRLIIRTMLFFGLKVLERRYDLIHYCLPQIMSNWQFIQNRMVTIHDVTHESHAEFHTELNINNAKSGIELIKKIKPRLIAVSDSTKTALRNITSFCNDDISVVYEAIDHHKFHILFDQRLVTNKLEKYSLINENYFFCLATNEPRKNLKNVLLAFLKLISDSKYNHIKIVLGGNPGWKNEDLPDHPNIIKTGYLPDEDLCALHNAAIGFCYVSYQEGFGLPPLEAMRCGTVPIYGDNSAMREVIGDFGIPAKPNDVDDISSKMELLIKNDGQRRIMEKEAYYHSLKFNMQALAKNMIQEYHSALQLK